jgi:Predicted ATPase with chaperone activity
VQRYRSRLSGPLLDRIDLHVEVPAVPYRDLKQGEGSISSATMQGRINAAREVQRERYDGLHFSSNSELSGKWLERYCP